MEKVSDENQQKKLSQRLSGLVLFQMSNERKKINNSFRICGNFISIKSIEF